MLISHSCGTIHIEAPAKVNLFLEVLGKRDDGYHDVETVLCPISLFDQLSFTSTPDSEVRLELSLPATGAGPLQREGGDAAENRILRNQISGTQDDSAWRVPADASNLVVKAVHAVRQRLGLRHGAHIRLHKRIPASAGLGGGSSDAAAAIVAAMLAWGRWDRQLAFELAAQLGSDVPFYLGDTSGLGIALATGRGEKCTRLDVAPQLYFAVTHPLVGCATKAIYEHYSGSISAKSPSARRHSAEIVAACKAGQAEKIGAALWNTLQFSASCLNHWIETQLKMFKACGAHHVLMSGSGSSCFAMFANASLVDPNISDTNCAGTSDKAIWENRLRDAAVRYGIPRVYAVEAVYQPSIERQVEFTS